MPSSHFTLLKLLVQAMHILLGDKITVRSWSFAKDLLSKFVIGFQRLYGLSNVTFNLHLLTHVCDKVYHLGPLWYYSNFVFESCNGRLVRLVKGTRCLVSEVSKKFTRLQVVPRIIHENPIGDQVLQFGNCILCHKYVKHGISINGVFITGQHSLSEVSALEKSLLESNSIPVENNLVQYYH